MAQIRPFAALRPQPAQAAAVASRPYDVLNSNEAREVVAKNPLSFLQVTKSEVSLSPDIDIHSDLVYLQAKKNLNAMIAQGILIRESKPCYYIYALTMDGRTQTGLVAGSSVDDYNNDVIKKHEFTRPQKEQDRINHIATTKAQTGNVFLAYRSVAELDELIEDWKNKHAALYDFTAEDSIRHAIWCVDDDAVQNQITQIFEEKIPCTYIADGHHRAASAAKVRAALGNEAGASADIFLTTLFPSNQLSIIDYNRVAVDLNGLSNEAFLERISKNFDCTLVGKSQVKPSQPHEFGMYLDGNWYRLHAKDGSYTNDPIGVLDVTILQNLVLDQVLGIQDPRTDQRVDFVGGIRGLGELEQRVDSGDVKIAFSLYPVTMDQLFDIADSGQVMPPKSTWFEPKLRDGVLTHLID